jgi:hypothetical protein
MAYSAAALITDSYYLSGIVARNFEVVSATQMSDGLNLLNFILADKNINPSAIPFYQKYNMDAVIGQEMYHIPNLIIDDTLTFGIGDVRFPTQRVSRDEYFGAGRVNFSSLIVTWHPERSLNGTDIYLFPFPDTAYPMEIFGKFALNQVAADDDLSLSYEYAYLNYLKYKMAQRICDENTQTLPTNVLKELKDMEAKITAMNPIDFSQMYNSTLSNSGFSPTWAQVNLNGYWGP